MYKRSQVRVAVLALRHLRCICLWQTATGTSRVCRAPQHGGEGVDVDVGVGVGVGVDIVLVTEAQSCFMFAPQLVARRHSVAPQLWSFITASTLRKDLLCVTFPRVVGLSLKSTTCGRTFGFTRESCLSCAESVAVHLVKRVTCTSIFVFTQGSCPSNAQKSHVARPSASWAICVGT